MSSLGQMVAGVAHEINNPVTFISGNISHIDNYFQDLLDLVHLFQDYSPNLSEKVEDKIEEIELDYIEEDLPKILNSMSEGTKRIGNIVKSLRTFSRLDEAEMKSVDIHAGIDSVLMILKSRLKSKNYQIEVLKSYENLPDIYCYASALNQVFINILSNAIDAVKLKFYQQKRTEEQPTIWIKTEQLENDWIRIEISDNGSGMTAENCAKIFEPFFTTKPVGQGTGLGLSTSYQIIVEQHQGRINCISAPDKGAKFVIEIPMK
ncbi:MAG: ATP-binding protein, partial [Cyanobacteria bacterium J06592_8]